ncbi:serine hydrolase domain-containing protein [Lysobacter sp. CA199]|uniref:serine hydrolase domain-containing protein n=1 Tax=Lysobacter sp. CA199 TaxID=3455608 RepID=UPI003F8D0B51
MSVTPVLPLVRNPLSAVCAIALFSLATPSIAADTCDAPTTDAAAATSQRMLQALVDTNAVPGMGAAVWRNGHVVWTGCAGLRDVEARKPVRRDTVFRLASVSKVIAATAAAKLAEEGRLDIDAPVGGVLPWLPAAWSPVTVRQLASHTSGAPHYAGNDLDVLGHVRYPTARDAVGIFSGRALLSAPGTSYSYSSWGYTLLGAMIEATSGEHFLDYVRRHVTDGLAIGADGDASAKTASQLYAIEHGATVRMPRTDMSYTWPGGGLSATPEALARFGGRVLEHRIVGTARWRAMQQPTLLASGAAAHERDYDIGFGWRLGRDADGDRIAHHAGITTGARSVLMLWPEQDTAASVLSNALWVSAMEPTAHLLAAPFRPRPPGLIAADCPASGRMTATLKAARFDLQATFRLERGRCVGELAAPAPLREYFAKASAWPSRSLRIVAMTSDGTLSRAALATPFGLYELRAVATQQWSVTLNGGAALELAIQPEDATEGSALAYESVLASGR